MSIIHGVGGKEKMGVILVVSHNSSGYDVSHPFEN
jgi:hypothetical protein